MEITTDFSTGGAGGGPSVAAPPNSGDTLTYTCIAGSPVKGTANPCRQSNRFHDSCTPVVTFGATTLSDNVGDAASTSWVLANDPSYAAGTYTAVATYTISAS